MNDELTFKIPDNKVDAGELLQSFKNFLKFAEAMIKKTSFNARVESGSNVYALSPQCETNNISFMNGAKKINDILNNVNDNQQINLPDYELTPLKKLINYAYQKNLDFAVNNTPYKTDKLYRNLFNQNLLNDNVKNIAIPQTSYTMLCLIKGKIYQLGNASKKNIKEFTLINDEDDGFNLIRCIIDDINDDYLGFLKNQERVAVSGEIDFDEHNNAKEMRVDFLQKDVNIVLSNHK